MKYVNYKKIESIKLNKENFYIVIDFDRTLTKAGSISTWRVLYHSALLGNDFKIRYDEIHDKNGKTWEERFKGYIELLREKKLSDEIIKEAVIKTDLQLRDGAKEFLKELHNINVPVIIISCGLKNVVK